MKSSATIFYVLLVTLPLILVRSVEQVTVTGSPYKAGSDGEGESGRVKRFLVESVRANATCDKYPRVCRVSGSPGPDCCDKKCVNVSTDRLNCGKCRMKCKYSEICCRGSCVNPSVDEKHCGGCNNKCTKGSHCVYGLCNYA